MFAYLSKLPMPIITGSAAAFGLSYGGYSAIAGYSTLAGLPFLIAGIISAIVTAYLCITQRQRNEHFANLVQTGQITGPYRRLIDQFSDTQINQWQTATPRQRTRAAELSFHAIPESQQLPIHHPMVVRYAISHYLLQVLDELP